MRSKTRKIIFTVVSVLLSLITVWFVSGYCSTVANSPINVDNVGNMYVDGSNFRVFGVIGTLMVNQMTTIIFFAFLFVFNIILMLITWLVFGILSFRKNKISSSDELSFSRKVFLISSLGAVVIGLGFMVAYSVCGKSGLPFASLLFCWQNPLFMWLFYIRRLKKVTK